MLFSKCLTKNSMLLITENYGADFTDFLFIVFEIFKFRVWAVYLHGGGGLHMKVEQSFKVN